MAQLVKKVFSKYLVFTNTVICGSLVSTGDLITQNVEQRFMNRKKDGQSGVTIDWKRTGRMYMIGIILGPATHLWYNVIIDRFIKGVGNKMVFKKILADQFVAGPVFCSAFFFGMGLFEGRGFHGAVGEVKENFIPVYMIDWCFWPPAQYINFRFLPVQYRVVYVCSLTLCWNTFLSYMKHRHQGDIPHGGSVPTVSNSRS